VCHSIHPAILSLLSGYYNIASSTVFHSIHPAILSLFSGYDNTASSTVLYYCLSCNLSIAKKLLVRFRFWCINLLLIREQFSVVYLKNHNVNSSRHSCSVFEFGVSSRCECDIIISRISQTYFSNQLWKVIFYGMAMKCYVVCIYCCIKTKSLGFDVSAGCAPKSLV
jgi:hypothetical protein